MRNWTMNDVNFSGRSITSSTAPAWISQTGVLTLSRSRGDRPMHTSLGDVFIHGMSPHRRTILVRMLGGQLVRQHIK